MTTAAERPTTRPRARVSKSTANIHIRASQHTKELIDTAAGVARKDTQ